jgi:hypothetical protein
MGTVQISVMLNQVVHIVIINLEDVQIEMHENIACTITDMNRLNPKIYGPYP